MGFFNTLKEVMTNKPSTLREPTFLKEFNEDNDKLKALVKAKPKNVEELRKVNGFGSVKCERYGKDIVEIINKNC